MINKRHGLFLILLGICAPSLWAQQSSNASGGTFTGSGGTVDYSIGQVAYSYVSAASNTASEGIQQPYEFFSTGIDEAGCISMYATVYPNPTASIVNLMVEDQGTKELAYALYDIEGRFIFERLISDKVTVIPMQELAVGSYLLSVTDAHTQTQLKSFKIIKNN